MKQNSSYVTQRQLGIVLACLVLLAVLFGGGYVWSGALEGGGVPRILYGRRTFTHPNATSAGLLTGVSEYQFNTTTATDLNVGVNETYTSTADPAVAQLAHGILVRTNQNMAGGTVIGLDLSWNSSGTDTAGGVDLLSIGLLNSGIETATTFRGIAFDNTNSLDAAIRINASAVGAGGVVMTSANLCQSTNHDLPCKSETILEIACFDVGGRVATGTVCANGADLATYIEAAEIVVTCAAGGVGTGNVVVGAIGSVAGTCTTTFACGVSNSSSTCSGQIDGSVSIQWTTVPATCTTGTNCNVWFHYTPGAP